MGYKDNRGTNSTEVNEGGDVKKEYDSVEIDNRGGEKCNNKEGDKKKRLLWLLLLLLLLVTVVTALGVLKSTDKTNGGNQVEIGIDGDLSDGDKSKEDVQAMLNKKVEEGMMNVSMNTNIVLEKGDSKANLQIENKKTNNYMQFVELYKDGKELIYKSGAIPVGKRIEEAKLDVNLPKGEYRCVAYFNALGGDMKSIVGKVGVNISVKVLN